MSIKLFATAVWGKIKSIIDVIPFLQPLTSFSKYSHKKALIKWFVLVLAASAPVLLTVLLSPIPNGDLSLWGKLMKKLTESISISEQFVYCAAFLAPTLYLVWEKILYDRDNKSSRAEKTPYEKLRSAMRIYKGYGWILISSILILSLTALGFSFLKTGNPTFNKTFLYSLLEQYSSYIYIFSLYAFYLSIIQDYGADGEFSKTVKEEEQDVASGLSARVNKGVQA